MGRLIFFLSLIFLLLVASDATEFIVGGKESKTFWRVPHGNQSNLNYWAEENRFSKGDVLVWKSADTKDSVLKVNKEAYNNCNTTSDSVIKVERELTLDHSGPFYFISGCQGHCKKGLKLEVVVLSDHLRKLPLVPAPAPATTSGSYKVINLGSMAMGATFVSLLFL
ncbi:Early nodulin-like protein 1 [Linum grandiflorum]